MFAEGIGHFDSAVYPEQCQNNLYSRKSPFFAEEWSK
jgi:hypothetical protein